MALETVLVAEAFRTTWPESVTLAIVVHSGVYADPAAHAEIVSRIPLGWIAEPDEVAKAVLYLASDLAAYVTGTEIVVDAGYTVR
jgi:NAD(P)-dependent dehydrogenase (short-subunit alcohol dehydrogenase family)